MNKAELVKEWINYKKEVINEMDDYSENDIFIEDFNVSDEDFEFLTSIPLKIVIGMKEDGE